MLWMRGSRVSYHWVILLTHWSTLSPLIYVSAMAIFLMGDLNPSTPILTQMYVSSLFINASACCLSPLKIWGGEPIMRTSGFAGIRTKCATSTGGSAPPPGPPGLLGPLGPPPDGGLGPVWRKAASKAFLISQASGFGILPLDVVPPPVPPVPDLLVVAAGVARVVVVVDVMAIVADPIISFSCFIRGRGLL